MIKNILISFLLFCSLSAGDIVVSWPKITNAVRYDVWYGYSVGITTIEITAQNKLIIENVSPGQTYHIGVKSIDAAGKASKLSEILKITVPDKKPAKLLATPKPSAEYKE